MDVDSPAPLDTAPAASMDVDSPAPLDPGLAVPMNRGSPAPSEAPLAARPSGFAGSVSPAPLFSTTRRVMLPPEGVNFTALDRMFSRIRWRRSGSATTSSSRTSARSTANDRPFAVTFDWMMSWTSCTSVGRCTGFCSSTTRPLSMRLISSTSLMSDSRCWLAVEIFRR